MIHAGCVTRRVLNERRLRGTFLLNYPVEKENFIVSTTETE